MGGIKKPLGVLFLHIFAGDACEIGAAWAATKDPRQAKPCKLEPANLASKSKTLKQLQSIFEKEVNHKKNT